MKIAFIYDAVYPWEVGGAQKRVWEIAKRLADSHDIHMFGMKYWDGPSTIEREGVTLHGVCEPIELYTGERRSITQAVRFAASVAKPLFTERFDVVDCQEFPYFPILVAKSNEWVTETATVVTWYEVWGDYWYEYLGWKGGFGKAIELLTARLPLRMITVSEKIKRDLTEIGRSPDIINVVPDGIDFDKIQSIPSADQSFDVVYAGRLLPHKNVDKLIQAVDTLNRSGSVTCAIIGDGPQKEELVRLVTELQLQEKVEFFGFFEKYDDVVAQMKSARVLVLPSVREGAGLVTLEANACGLPAITVQHRNNAATEVVVDGLNGFICQPSITDLARKIRTALEQAADMEKDCFEFSKSYDWDEIATMTESVYKSII
ncbi:glycosyltransferase family 4 protein [Haladaptatus caseinilyticus]|uniref:glycosyltransferase family 4 protein n=1 Tax=Haladaptatus caseinilyticus TaxID=2993314 RepID=UPI00224A6064|nr:glycosyltransferase family 4 protein [Haladaptatus caseinilyticus]